MTNNNFVMRFPLSKFNYVKHVRKAVREILLSKGLIGESFMIETGQSLNGLGVDWIIRGYIK